MERTTRKILMLVEGERADVKLMKRLLSLYQLDVTYEIVPYRTNIYTLYGELFAEGSPEDMDLLQLLKSREPDPQKWGIFETAYTDILLVFDLDPQDPQFSPEKIRAMADYFVESTDMGKLYLNYPMVEAFYHMCHIPDPQYGERVATLEELRAKTYKARVNQENRNHNPEKFATTVEECTQVIGQNVDKAWKLVGKLPGCGLPPDQREILEEQLRELNKRERVWVLSTCPFFLVEYRPHLFEGDIGT